MVPIAFVDDHKMARESIVKRLHFLSPSQYRVHEYESGQNFIDRFPTENYVPAIVLMDISMPGINGYDTTAWIKNTTLLYPFWP